MQRRLSISAPIALILAVAACSDGPTPPVQDPIVVAMQQLGTAFNSGTERGEFAWYAIAALEHGAELTQFTADVDGQARTFDGVALGIVYDEESSPGGPIYRDSLVVLVGWRGNGASEMIASAHLSDNFPTEDPVADLQPELVRRPRGLPAVDVIRRGEIRPAPAQSIGVLAAGDLELHFLWYMVESDVWIDSIVRTAQANLEYGTVDCIRRTLTLPPGYQFDTENFPCRRGSFRQAIDVRLWPEVDAQGQPLAEGRFNLVMRAAEYDLPNILDLLQ